MLPTSTDVSFVAKSPGRTDGDATVVFVSEGAKRVDDGSDDIRRSAGRVLAAGVVKGKAKEVGFDIVEAGKGKFRRVFVVGLGKKPDGEALRVAGAIAAKALRK